MLESVLNMIRRLVSCQSTKQIAMRLLNVINQNEYHHPPFPEFNERPVEYRYVFENIGKYYPKTVLDVGTGRTALPHVISNCGCRVTAIDNIHDYWPRGLNNRHYYIIHDDIVNTKLTDRFDMVICISTLEHIEQYDQAVRSMFRLLRSPGYLVLTGPYNENQHIENVYLETGSSFEGKAMPYKASAFSRADLERWQKENDVRIIDQEYWQFFDGEHWSVGSRILPPIQVNRLQNHQLSCVLFEKYKSEDSIAGEI